MVDKIFFLRQAFMAKFEKTKDHFHVINMAEQRAPLVSRYFECDGLEGYLYCIIQNDDDEAVYTEDMELDKDEKLQMMPPFEGISYSIRVDPGKFEIVIIKVFRGFNFTPQRCDMNVILGDNALRKLAIEKNFKIKRSGEEIFLYKAWHDNGFVTLYVN